MTGRCDRSPNSSMRAMSACFEPAPPSSGAIWQVQDNIAVDFGLRGARTNGQTAGEIRAGVTFAFGVTKGPDILSRLSASALHGSH